MSDRPNLMLVDGVTAQERPGRDPRAALERLLSPDLLQALDAHIRELAEEIAEQKLAAIEFADGRVWLTLREAGELLGCTPQAVRMRVKRGRLEGKYQGRRLYVSARSVQELG